MAGVAENVGVGYSVQALHDAFMGSTGHRANILNASYNRVGIGVVHVRRQDLGDGPVPRRAPPSPGRTGLGPPPPPPGVRDRRSPATSTVTATRTSSPTAPARQADELWFGRDNRSLHAIVDRA